MSKAFGEQNPNQGEDAVSWQTWSDGNGGVPTITGNADWGKLSLQLSGAEGRSAVYDLGSAVSRTFTLTENRYGTGSETATLQIRGDASSFLQDDNLPAWEDYISPVTRTWRYVQIREITFGFLSIDATGRYLKDGNGNPILLMGDTAWELGQQITDADVTTYLSNRASKGFNLVIMELIEHYFCTNAPNDYYDNPPFTGTNFTTPNETYFARMDNIIQKARNLGIYVIVAPLYLGFGGSDEGWDTEIAAASEADMTSWGEYVGNRYKDYTNIIWCIGGDADPTALLAKVNAFVTGLRNYDTNHLITFHDARNTKGSTHLAGASWLTLQSIYTGEIVDTLAADAYDDSPAKPFILIESYYEDHAGTTQQELRAEGYNALICGACGYIFGNGIVWNLGYLGGDWQAAMNDTGSVEMGYYHDLISAIDWFSLVPDTAHALLTSGYGTPGASDFAPAAMDAGGTLGLIYMPSNRTMSVDMSQFSGTVTCRWFDPTDGTYTADAASPHVNSGTHDFSRAGANSAGDADWLLLLEA